jgi:hypothetical protein
MSAKERDGFLMNKQHRNTFHTVSVDASGVQLGAHTPRVAVLMPAIA